MTREFWVRCSFYEPFTMGGSLWRDVRYRVEGVACRRLEQYEIFGFFRAAKGVWQLHETSTGGWLGEGSTMALARKMARENVRSTPDLSSQIQRLGPVKRLPEVSAEEAFRRLDKNG